ncbi:MAG: hypothetical protein Q8R15_04250 [Candidatus Micrarchaeota archaeon]|nr:hypothetical protein [Candidatus Micrarchaeota archaeon]
MLYKCSECGLKYREKETAKKCEAFCKKYNACSLEIIKHAVK